MELSTDVVQRQQLLGLKGLVGMGGYLAAILMNIATASFFGYGLIEQVRVRV